MHVCNWLPHNLGLRLAKQEKQLGEEVSCSRSLFFILPNLSPCANYPSCELGQLPAALEVWRRKICWQAHVAVQSRGLRRAESQFFSQSCCRKCQAVPPKPHGVVGACICKGLSQLGVFMLRFSDICSESIVGVEEEILVSRDEWPIACN